MSRRDIHDYAFFHPIGDLFKDSGQFAVVRANYVSRIHMLDEVKEALSACDLYLLALISLKKLRNAPFLLIRHAG